MFVANLWNLQLKQAIDSFPIQLLIYGRIYHLKLSLANVEIILSTISDSVS